MRFVCVALWLALRALQVIVQFVDGRFGIHVVTAPLMRIIFVVYYAKRKMNLL